MKNIRFATKILAVAALLALTAGVLSWRGIAGMSDVREDLEVVEGSFRCSLGKSKAISAIRR